MPHFTTPSLIAILYLLTIHISSYLTIICYKDQVIMNFLYRGTFSSKLRTTEIKITTMFNHMNFFKCTRVFVIKLCIICFLLLLTYILTHIYCHTKVYVHISYCGDFDLYPTTNTTTTKCARSHGCGDSVDIICSKAIQGMGKSGSVNDTQILQYTDENQQKTLLNSEHDYMKQANNISTQKEGKRQKNDIISKQRNVRDIGINATHINGILMEPVNANYSRNIYFTVKTTHKYYTNRLFPLMLTWLQAVDKNKVR